MVRTSADTFSRALRLRIFQRDNFTCQNPKCMKRYTDTRMLHADHRVPVADGGGTTLENGLTLCGNCNLRKGSKPPDWLDLNGHDQHKKPIQPGRKLQSQRFKRLPNGDVVRRVAANVVRR